MPIDPSVVGQPLPPQELSYSKRDVMLYALGIGAGESRDDLKFVYEKELEVFPLFGVTVPFSALIGFLQLKGVNINPAMLLHGEQYLEIKQHPLPTKGKLLSKSRVKSLYDKGKGAFVELEATTEDEDGRPLFYNVYGLYIRGEGGFGGEKGPDPGNFPPEREPDKTAQQKTLVQQALLYRLSGDYNPIHSDPAFAAKGGFDRPILHGLCTLGFAARAVLKAFCDNDPSRFKAIQVRFSRHVFPGETIVTEMWQESGDKIIFRSKTAERNEECLSNGAVWLNP